jgi:hypothetical protein
MSLSSAPIVENKLKKNEDSDDLPF